MSHSVFDSTANDDSSLRKAAHRDISQGIEAIAAKEEADRKAAEEAAAAAEAKRAAEEAARQAEIAERKASAQRDALALGLTPVDWTVGKDLWPMRAASLHCSATEPLLPSTAQAVSHSVFDSTANDDSSLRKAAHRDISQGIEAIAAKEEADRKAAEEAAAAAEAKRAAEEAARQAEIAERKSKGATDALALGLTPVD